MSPTAVVGARRLDHVALTVPDLDAAVAFAVEVIGGELVYRLPPLAHRDDWMLRHLDVHPRASAEIALLRLGPTTNLELFAYRSPDQLTQPRRPHQVGASQLGLVVDDVDTAVAHLVGQHGLRCFAPPRTTADGAPDAGVRWVRLSSPWAIPLELRSVPDRLPYEDATDARCFRDGPLWTNGADGRPARSAVPGLRGVDHVGYTVGDLDAAVAFFTDVLGAEPVFAVDRARVEPALAAALGAPPDRPGRRAVLRLGPTATVELWAWPDADPPMRPPANSDIGGRHLALHVDDVDAAAAQLAAVAGCTVLSGPETITEGPIAGDRWVYVQTPIGLPVELVNMPDGALPYERHTAARRRAAGSLSWWDR